MSISSRTIIIGDIHGCFEELQELLGRCDAGPDDQIVSVGDLVDRGPDPAAVVDFFTGDSRCRAIFGNHEDKHVRWRRGELSPSASQIICREQMGDDQWSRAVDWFESLPLYLDLPEILIVHAGLEPGVVIAEQPRNALLRCRMSWMTSAFDESALRWRERYDGQKPVAFGHHVIDSPGPVNQTWALDQGVCHGGPLTALVLPGYQIVQVTASGDHWNDVKSRYRDLLSLKKKPRPRRQRPRGRKLLVEGTKIDGRWILEHVDRTPGPWIATVLREMKEEVDAGRCSTLEQAAALVERLATNHDSG